MILFCGCHCTAEGEKTFTLINIQKDAKKKKTVEQWWEKTSIHRILPVRKYTPSFELHFVMTELIFQSRNLNFQQ